MQTFAPICVIYDGMIAFLHIQHRMPFPLLLVALLFLALPLRAQEKENTVLLTAHLVDGEDDKALLAPWGVNFICDALDQAVVAIPDSTGYVELRLPRGKCVVIPEFYYPVTLNLTADTVVERLELTYDAFNRSNIYRSRHKKDSTLRAEEAALKADLHYVDTSYSFLDPDPNYYLLAQLYEYDLHYPLPRWRTFSRDSALHYLRYSYHQNPERYDYLYYPICQLEHALGLPHDRKVRRPKAPDSRWYAPLPEVKDGWIVDTITSYMDLYDRARNMSHHLALELAPQGEKSLVYPRRKKRTAVCTTPPATSPGAAPTRATGASVGASNFRAPRSTPCSPVWTRCTSSATKTTWRTISPSTHRTSTSSTPTRQATTTSTASNPNGIPKRRPSTTTSTASTAATPTSSPSAP